MNLPPVTVADDNGVAIEIAPEELPGGIRPSLAKLGFEFHWFSDERLVCGLDIRTAGPRRFITDAVHERLDFSATIRAVENFRRKYPSCSGTFIENTANGAASIDLLGQRLPGINKVNATKSKYDRAMSASDELNANNWFVPHPSLAELGR
jgi:phage terminase large subunit-like protein